jgi:hypothetical protein
MPNPFSPHGSNGPLYMKTSSISPTAYHLLEHQAPECSPSLRPRCRWCGVLAHQVEVTTTRPEEAGTDLHSEEGTHRYDEELSLSWDRRRGCLCDYDDIAQSYEPLRCVENDETKQELTPKCGAVCCLCQLSSCDFDSHQLLNLINIKMDLDSKIEYPQEKISIAVLGCG